MVWSYRKTSLRCFFLVPYVSVNHWLFLSSLFYSFIYLLLRNEHVDINQHMTLIIYKVGIYDKCDNSLFHIVQFSGNGSNVPQSTVLGVFLSQIIWYFRICSDVDGFADRLRNIVDKSVSLGFKKELLKSRFISISKKHDLTDKYGNIDDLNGVFDWGLYLHSSMNYFLLVLDNSMGVVLDCNLKCLFWVGLYTCEITSFGLVLV